MNNLYRGPSIDASYQNLVHLAKWFQRRRLKCEKLMDDELKNVKNTTCIKKHALYVKQLFIMCSVKNVKLLTILRNVFFLE
jgi:hypothetical protein